VLTVGSCKVPECFACPPSQFAVASEGMSVACIAGIVAVAVAELGNCMIAEGPVEVLAEVFAAEGLAVDCSGRTDSSVGLAVVVAEVAAGIHCHRTPAHLAAALATAL